MEKYKLVLGMEVNCITGHNGETIEKGKIVSLDPLVVEVI